MKTYLKTFYLDWLNNFLTVQAMADYYGIDSAKCERMISIGSALYYELPQI